MCFISVADLYLPMDSADNGVMQGTILGTMKGAVTIIPGADGGALYISDITAYIDYGYHHGSCFANPIRCTSGITMSMWLKLHSTLDYGAMINTGSSRNTYSHYIGIVQKGSLYALIQDESEYIYSVTTPMMRGKWLHIIVTYLKYEGIRVFLNSCDLDADKQHGYASERPRRREFSQYHAFWIGRRTDNGKAIEKMTLDEYVVWHQRLSDSQIWEMYMNGW